MGIIMEYVFIQESTECMRIVDINAFFASGEGVVLGVVLIRVEFD